MDNKYKVYLEELIATGKCSASYICPDCPVFKYCADIDSTIENDIKKATEILKENN